MSSGISRERSNHSGPGVKTCENQNVKIKFTALIFIIPFLFLGCAASNQYAHFPDQTKIVEDPGKGRIYVMRPGLTGIGIPTDVRDNGTLIGNTGPHGYLCWERKPGYAIISAEADDLGKVKVNVQAGQVNYIIQKMEFGWISTDNRLDIVSEAAGREALKKCKPPIGVLPSSTATNSTTVSK
jgi:hypothetical protein